MKFPVTHSFPASCHFLPLRSKYSTWYHVLKCPQSVLFFIMRDQVSYPYKTTGKIVILCILSFKFLEKKQIDERFGTDWYQPFPEFNPLLIICVTAILICYCHFQIFEICHIYRGLNYDFVFHFVGKIQLYTLLSLCLLLDQPSS